jgi:hypothetical protein
MDFLPWLFAATDITSSLGENMKKILLLIAFALCSLNLHAQNLTTISASNIQDINGAKLALGQLCFLITDQQDNPISVSIGGGGQALKRGYCSPIAAGVVTTFTVPNPANTQPAGIYYRVTVKDSSSGLEVLRYTQVSFTGATFNFDNYAPQNLGTPAPLSGNSVTGNLSVTGNVAATGTVTGTNIPSSILQQIFNAGTGLTQRTAFNVLAGVTCSDNAGTLRTDCRAGGLNTVTFSATPTFDASTNSMFKLTLTGNVTSSTLSNAVAGEQLSFEICQDATGGRTFTQPGNVQGWITPSTAASTCTVQAFWFDGTNAQPDLEPPVTGDVTQSAGSTAATVAKVNGVSYPSAPSTHQLPIVTAANTAAYKTVPDCQDSSGNHINYTQSTDAFSCGTSVPANTVTTTGTQTLTNKTLTSPVIGATTISEAPRMVLAVGFHPGNIAVNIPGAGLIPKPVTVEGISVHSQGATSSCTVNPTLRVRNSGSTVTTPTLTLTTGGNDWSTSGNNVNYSAPDTLFIEITSAGTCTTPPSNLIINVIGRMQ